MVERVFVRKGMYTQFDIFDYRPNPFWSAEENQRFRHLGNLERFGTWHPPGPHERSYSGWCEERVRFQFTNRPMPTDHLLPVEEHKWKTMDSQGQSVFKLMYGIPAGFIVGSGLLGGYLLYKKMAVGSSDHDHHH